MKCRKKPLRILKVCAILLFCGMTVAIAQTPERIAQDARAATVLLEMKKNRGGNPQGSGFFIGNGLIATNYHVIEGATAGTVKLVNAKERFDIQGYTAIDKQRDLAIVSVANLQAPRLPLGNSDTVRVGETVYTIGNPRGLEGTFAAGHISNIQRRETPQGTDKMLQITAPISPGSSGGAVLNTSGEVIGIAVETRDDGQNLNFAIPVNVLKQLLRNMGPVTSLAADAPLISKNPGPNLLGLLLLSAVAFCIIKFIPTVNAENLLITIGVAIGLGVIKTLTITIMTHPIVPTMAAESFKTFLTASPPDNLIHALEECNNCFQQLLFSIIKVPTYIIGMAFLLGIANKAIPGFKLEGFFNTFFVAALIVGGEVVLLLLIPWF